jgi:excisionase family DNA binding protein
MLKLMSGNESEQVDGPWLGYEEAAAYTHLSESYLRKLVMRGAIPFRKVGKRVVFSQPELDGWISRNGQMNADSAA